MSKSGLLIFDLDGTLVDSRKDLVAGVNHMRAYYDLPALPLETVAGYIGDGVRALVERSLQGAPVDVDEALQVNKDYYFSHLTVHTFLYPGVAEGLRKLADAGYQLAVLTNKPGGASREILEHFELKELFIEVMGGYDGVALKPDPAGIERLIERGHVALESVWMVGDHCTDMAVAENAGVKSAFVEYGFGTKKAHKPNQQFASFSALVEYFV